MIKICGLLYLIAIGMSLGSCKTETSALKVAGDPRTGNGILAGGYYNVEYSIKEMPDDRWLGAGGPFTA